MSLTENIFMSTRLVLFFLVFTSISLFVCFFMIILLPLRFLSPSLFIFSRHFLFKLWVDMLICFLSFSTEAAFVVYLPAQTESFNAVQHSLCHFFATVLQNGLPILSPLPDCSAELGNLVIMSNHQLYTDWIFVLSLLSWNRAAGSIYIVLKRSLQFVPIFGFGMKLCDFLFLNRDWVKDQHKFVRRLNRISKIDDKCNILIFPEGTTLCADAFEQMISHSTKLKKAPFNHVLIPKVSGTFAALNGLSRLRGILDLTIAYEDEFKGFPEDRFGLWDVFARHEMPLLTHFYLNRIQKDQIPYSNRTDLTSWLYDLFKEKDNKLSSFKISKQFPNNTVKVPLRIPLSPYVPETTFYFLFLFLICLFIGDVLFKVWEFFRFSS